MNLFILASLRSSKRAGKKGVAVTGTFLTVCLIIISGCTSGIGETTTAYETRKWASRTYRFDIQIDTEPPGAKIYVQDSYVGQSPLLTKIKANEVTITQSGSYPRCYSYDRISGRVTNYQRTGNTIWNYKLSGSFRSADYGWLLKIYKDGYEPLEYRITRASLKQFDEAIDSLKIDDNDQLPLSFTASEPEYFRFTLNPAAVTYSPPPSQRPAACQQVPIDQTNALAAARQE